MHSSSLLLALSCLALPGITQAQSSSPNPLASSGAALQITQGVFGAAVLTGYEDHASWLAAFGGGTTLVDFNAIPDGTLITGTGALIPYGILDTSGSSIHASGGITNQYVTSSASLPFPMFIAGTLPSEPNFFSNDLSSTGGYSCGETTIIFAGPTTACGCYIADQKPLGGMYIEVFNGTTSLGSILTSPRTLPSSFAGIVSDTPFTSVRFHAESTEDSWGIDNFEHNAGAEVEINVLDERERENETSHDSRVYRQDYVLRRGATFDVEMNVSKVYGSEFHEVSFEARHSFDGGTTVITIPNFEGTLPSDQWGSKVVNEVVEGDETKTLTVRINIPPNAAVGEYQFKALVTQKGSVLPDAEENFDDPIVIVFNPWSTDDQVTMPNNADRQEYVLRETGRIWRGNHPAIGPKSWAYDQFDANGICIKVTLGLLSGLNAAQRADAKLVSRQLSALVNSNGGGVLTGRWDGVYTGGRSPGSWSGSLAILKQYDTTGSAVRYGQCWVFGGVLTTCLRTLGIPSRPLSNFQSAHDEDGDKEIGFYFSAAGAFQSGPSESVWNYHVWCDARIDGGWNAVDATPQELSGGVFQMGPAPVASVKADAGGLYDVDFVFAEVDADVKYYQDDGTGSYVLRHTDDARVGKQIVTKARGGVGLSDITTLYKNPPSPSPGGSVDLPSGISLTLDAPGVIDLGSDIIWTLHLTNGSGGQLAVRSVWSSEAVDYSGGLGILVSLGINQDVTTTLNPGATESVTFTISEAAYIAWTGDTLVFQVDLILTVLTTTDAWASVGTTELVAGTIDLLKNPDIPVVSGASVTVTATYANPIASDLTNATLTFLASEGATIEGSSSVVVNLGTIVQGGSFSTAKLVDTNAGGDVTITVLFDSDQLSDVEGETMIAILPDFATPYCFCTTGPCGNDDAAAGCANTTGSGSFLTADGSPSVAENEFILSASNARASQFGIFYYGPNQALFNFGDGHRCVGGGALGIFRLGVVNSDEAGLATHTMDFTDPPGAGGEITVGSTWSFQYWYRDPGGPCGSQFNLSNAITVTFQP